MAVVIVAAVEASQRLDGVPGEVLAAFGLAGVVPLRLPGGQGTAWRVGTDGVHSAARTAQPVTELVLARLTHPAR